jgi:hypothetical protein
MAPHVGAPATTDGEQPDSGVASAPIVAAPVVPMAAPGRAQSLPREADRAHERWAAEEKEHRRLRRNIITAAAGIVMLLLLALILMKIAG